MKGRDGCAVINRGSNDGQVLVDPARPKRSHAIPKEPIIKSKASVSRSPST